MFDLHIGISSKELTGTIDCNARKSDGDYDPDVSEYGNILYRVYN
jgi:hypothetical protein